MAVGRPVRQGISLRRHSTFRIGGKADFFFAAGSARELEDCLRLAHDRGVPHYVIGAGTNLLFDDAGFRGLIIKNEVRGIERKSGESRVRVRSGTALSELVAFCLEEGLEGLEFAAGIPGTVGGAVYGNAGAWGSSIGQRLVEGLLLDETARELPAGNDFFRFGYRQSHLKTRHLTLLEAVFELRTGDRGLIRERIEESLAKRKAPCPSDKMAYCGSFFKNPVLPDGTKLAAGRLLEKVGAKELKYGSAAVYAGHANFIVNLGRARAADILNLAREMKARVEREFGVRLEEEVIYLPAGP
ncbi:MAG: UDP-N-acetylenolpyruvoylglucosamine reductase [Candidatus Aminicenantes bacterium RBG_16_63_16]|nr:MAG: UDP-N-acetylenolpyruvoylglucosamine reductase [Candidatus Aminicenantes bacterium RBG_16_63_16]